MKSRIISIMLLCLTLVLMVNVVSATDVSSFSELDAVITNNTDENEIELDNDVIKTDNEINNGSYEEGIIINTDTVINGNGHSIDANGNGRIFTVNNCSLTLNNVILKNGGVYDDYGGAIFAESSTLLLNNVSFVNNSALAGGALYLSNSNINIIGNSLFAYNSALIGGSMALISSNVVNKENIVFNNNQAYMDSNIYTNTKKEIDSQNFDDMHVSIFEDTSSLDSLKTISIESNLLTIDDFKDIIKGSALGKTYFVSNFDELSFVFNKLHAIDNAMKSIGAAFPKEYFEYKLYSWNSSQKNFYDNNMVNAFNLTANIILLPGNYEVTNRLNISSQNTGPNIQKTGMNIVIYGNNQILNCSKLNDSCLFYIEDYSSLLLSGITLSDSNNNINQNQSCIIDNRGSLTINNCNFIDNVLESYQRVTYQEVQYVSGIEAVVNPETSEITYVPKISNYTKIIVSKDYGRVISSSGDLFIGSNVTFANNFVSNCLIYNDAFSYVLIKGNNINFIGNTVNNVSKRIFGEIGATIYNQGNLMIYGHDINFMNNFVNGSGGVIYSSSWVASTIIFGNNINFINNEVTGNGGVVYTNDPLYCIGVNINFINNTATNGGVIYEDYNGAFSLNVSGLINDESLIDYDCVSFIKQNYYKTFFNATLNQFVDLNNHVVFIGDNISFVNNSAVKGGALYVNHGLLNMTGNFIMNNSAVYAVTNDFYISSNGLLIANGIAYTLDTSISAALMIDIRDSEGNVYYIDYNDYLNTDLYNREVFNNETLSLVLNNHLETLSSYSTINYMDLLVEQNKRYTARSLNVAAANDYLLNNNDNSVEYDDYVVLLNSTKSKTLLLTKVNLENETTNKIVHYEFIENEKDLINFASNSKDEQWDVLYLNFANKTFNLPNGMSYFNFKNVAMIYMDGNGSTIKIPNKERKEDHFLTVNSNNHVSITNLTIRGFNTAIINYGSLNLQFCNFLDNRLNYRVDKDNGGAIINKGILIATNCSFINNYAKYGGAIYNDIGSHCALVNCTFENNTGYGHGDDLYNYGEVELDLNGTVCSMYNKSPNVAARIAIMVAAIVITAVAAVFTAGAAVALIGSTFALSAASMALIGAGVGAVVGAIIGAASGAIIAAITQQNMLENILTMMALCAVVGALAGAIGGSLADSYLAGQFEVITMEEAIRPHPAVVLATLA